MPISLGVMPLMIAMVIVLIAAVLSFFGIKSIHKGSKKFWLTGAIIASVLWIILFVQVLIQVLNSNEPLTMFGLLLPGLPFSFILSNFLSGESFFLMIIISDLLTLILVFLIGASLGRLVEKIWHRNVETKV